LKTDGIVGPRTVEVIVTTFTKDQGEGVAYKYQLTNVMVTSYSTSGVAAMEELTLCFDEIKFSYQAGITSCSYRRAALTKGPFFYAFVTRACVARRLTEFKLQGRRQVRQAPQVL
jgi:hypothetical protein